MEKKQTVSSVFKNRGFLNLWINQILVQLSYNSLNFALIIWVFKLSDSTLAVSALLFAFYLPAVILGLFSGILVDIIDRRKIILAVDLLLCVCFIMLIFFKMSFFAILAIAFLANALGQFYWPAEGSAIPIIVKKNQLIIANAIFSATLYTCFLLGFGLSGPLMNYFGIDFVLGIGALFLAIAFLLAFLFPPIKGEVDKEGRLLISAIKKGSLNIILSIAKLEILHTLSIIKGKLPVLTSVAIISGVQMVVAVLAVLIPSFLEKSLKIKATDASYVLILPLGLGIITGGILLGRFGRKLIKRKLVAKAILFAGTVFFIIGIAPFISTFVFNINYPVNKILAFGAYLMGLALVSILVPSQTVLQANTHEADRGKIFSVLGVAMAGLSLIPVLLVGIFTDKFGTTPIFITLGAVIFLTGLFGLKPSMFIKKEQVSERVREFLGLGHWEGK